MSSTSTDAKKTCQYCLEYVNIHITCFKCDAVYHIYCWKKVPGAYVNETGQLFCCAGLTSKYASSNTNLGTQSNPEQKVIEKGNVEDDNKDLKNCLIKVEDSEWSEFKCDARLLEFTHREHLETHYSECPNKEEEYIQELKEEKDLENCLHKEEDLEWNEFQCDVCLLEFTNNEHIEHHYGECPNKEREPIQDSNEDKDLENHLPDEFKRNSWSSEYTNNLNHLENHCNECPNEQGGSIKKINKDKAGLFCSFCNEDNFQKESYEHHIKRCHAESSYLQLDQDNDTCIINTKRNPTEVDGKEKKYKHTVCNDSTHVKGHAVKRMCIDSNDGSFKCTVDMGTEAPKSYFSSKYYDGMEKYGSGVCTFSTLSEDTFGCRQQTYTSGTPFKYGYMAAQRINLMDHVKFKHSNVDKEYKCGDYEYSTHKRDYLVKHIHSHTNEKPFKCDVCNYAATRKTHLKVHVLAKHSNTERTYKCRDCKYATHNKNNLIVHIRTHTNEKPFKCDMCDYAAARKAYLNAHVLVKHSNAEKIHKCGDCEYSAHIKASLLEHKRTHSKEKPFRCDMCEYAAISKANVRNHVLVKHSNAEKTYKCKDCKYSTIRKADLVNHIRIHTSEKPFKCDMCDYATARKTQLKRHVLVKHSNAEKMYKCEECEYSSYMKNKLLRHKRAHTKEKQFKCDVCDYAAARKTHLKRHFLEEHSNAEKIYKCEDCEYSSYLKNRLLIHKRTHTKEKPFKCDLCCYVAAQKPHLKTHILLKHSNAEKMHKCGDCEYSTHIKANLLEHKRTHTKEKPFMCDMV